MARRPIPIRDLVIELAAQHLTHQQILDRIRELGIQDGSLRTVARILEQAPPPASSASPPAAPVPAVDLPEMGGGQALAALSHVIRRLIGILDDPAETAAARIKAGEAAGQLAVVGVSIEQRVKPTGK